MIESPTSPEAGNEKEMYTPLQSTFVRKMSPKIIRDPKRLKKIVKGSSPSTAAKDSMTPASTSGSMNIRSRSWPKDEAGLQGNIESLRSVDLLDTDWIDFQQSLEEFSQTTERVKFREIFLIINSLAIMIEN